MVYPRPTPRPLTQNELRARFAAPDFLLQVAHPDDGSPAIAHGDTFVFASDAASGAPRKMPFATLVTKDYPGFDEASRLDSSGLFRLNLDIGRDAFTDLFGLAPNSFEDQRDRFDFAAVDSWMPHPLYGSYGWASIIAPSASPELERLIATTIARARR